MKDPVRASEGISDRANDPHVWMIRTSENVLSGPYTREQLIQLVEEEKLELTDEICRGNSYWIYLHEEQEVKKHLGIEVPAALVEPEEPTQTETDSIIAKRIESSPHHESSQPVTTQHTSMGARTQQSSTVSPEPANGAFAPAVQPGGSVSSESVPGESVNDVPELSVSEDSIEDHTAVLNNRAFREFRPRERGQPATPALPVTELSSQPEFKQIQIPVVPAIPEVEGVSVNGHAEKRGYFWIYTTIVLLLGALAIYVAWRRLRT